MPNYKGHLVGGLVVYCIALVVLIGSVPSLVTAFEWLLFALAGALFPDVDIKSKGQKYFYYLVFIIFVLLAYKGRFQALSCCSFIVITPMLTRHRGIFHSTWFVVSIPVIVWLAMSALYPKLAAPFFFDTFFFIAGALSHLFLDRGLSQMFRRRSLRSRNRR